MESRKTNSQFDYLEMFRVNYNQHYIQIQSASWAYFRKTINMTILSCDFLKG